MSTHIAKIPNPIPPPYDNFNSGWLLWVSSLDGKSLILGAKYFMGTDQGTNPGQGVVSDPPAPAHIVSWLPGEWVRERTTPQPQTSQPKSCDCPSRKLFQQGCPGH